MIAVTGQAIKAAWHEKQGAARIFSGGISALSRARKPDHSSKIEV